MKRDGFLTSGEWPNQVNKTGVLLLTKHRVHHGPYGFLVLFAMAIMCCWGWLFYLLYGALR
jgi:hypothetical protein